MEDLQEQYEARIMEEVNYIYYKQTKNQRDLDEIPFANGVSTSSFDRLAWHAR